MTDENQIEDQEVELHDEVTDEVVEEAHDPKNAEAQSVAATDKAGDATKAGTPPGGPGGKAEPMPKTKAAMINAMYVTAQKMNKQDLTCLLYTSPSPRDRQKSRMPSSA